MMLPPIPQNEDNRLAALKSYGLLDSIEEKEFDDITALAAQICETPIALISLIDEDRQWFKAKVGLEISETSREISFCAHTINNPNEPLVVEDAQQDSRFSDNPLVVGQSEIRFYAGIPLVDSDGFALGTLCAIDSKKRMLSESQLFGLQTLANSVVRLIELRKHNTHLISVEKELQEITNFANPFIIVLTKDLLIKRFGENYSKILPEMKEFDSFEQHFNWDQKSGFSGSLQNEEINPKSLYFFSSLDGKQKFKSSIRSFGYSYIAIFASPVINSSYPLSNYHIQYADFPKHDYVAEYLFLQQASLKSLAESKGLSDKMIAKNRQLEAAQKNIDALSRFPSENPNPVLRFSSDFELIYANDAAKTYLINDFLIDKSIGDLELKKLLEESIKSKDAQNVYYLSRNGRYYSISIRFISESDYINVYVSDITSFTIEIQRKEDETRQLSEEIEKQREFYEFVLNNIPSDIAVFSPDHKYVFVNPQGIKDPELRKFIIGKDDFDYCDFRGISSEIAVRRRAIFQDIVKSKTFLTWEDDLINKEGKRVVILRRMGPIYDTDGNLRLVIGYGVDITDRKLTEEKLAESYKRTLLLENFLNKSSDGIQVTNYTGQIVYMNHVSCERFGVNEQTFDQLNVRDFEPYFSPPGVWESHFEDLRSKKSIQIETININKFTGQKFEVEISANFQKIEGQEYLIAVSRDISERKKIRSEIERLSLVAKNTNNGVLMLDVNRKITWTNEAMIHRSGYAFEELVGNSPSKFQFEGTNSEVLQMIHAKMLKLESVSTEILHRSKHGEHYWIDLNIQPLFDTEGNHSGYMAVEIDITERKKFEETIEEQNKSLREISDALDQSSLVAVADKNGKIVRANKNFTDISQYSEEELIGQSHNIINSGEHPQEFWAHIWNTISSHQIWRGEIKNKAKDGSFYWVDSIIYPIVSADGNLDYFLGIHHEITAKKNAEQALEIKASFQRVLMEISTKYINLPVEILDQSINESLGVIGNFVQVDRVYVFDYNYTERTISNLFEWCDQDISPQIESLQNIPFESVPIWVKKHSLGHDIVVPNVKELPQGAFRDLIEEQDIKSLVALPMMDGKKCVGFVGFDSVKSLRVFSEDERNLLRLYAQMLVNIGNRTDYIKQIEHSKNEIEQINSGLELSVREKTEKNLELAKSITDQEKMVTIGEISSGIAHDLNTPLGAIKSGAESIRYTLENLFKGTIWKCSPEQIKYACNRAVEVDIELFIGGLQQRKEQKLFVDYISIHFPDIQEELRIELSASFVKARISILETDVIHSILTASNPIEFLDLIFHIQMTRTFVDTILSSTDRASHVVNDLRSFIKDQRNATKGLVNLHDNISIVLNIFNFQIKNTVDLFFDVDNTLSIEGFDIKLFQLWSNLIKNAIESMEETGQRGLLKIYSTETPTEISISVENNGPEIPMEIQEKIFEKFYTTKSKKSGSGLGLSIVKNIIDEHQASLILQSSSKMTKFSVTFNK
ncbi:MAG: PAS domain S-box protein [Crocinitomicaceae bacterium]|nr:PAS domain S-box protein [Crocinitomicaceae bacterium]